ncbi:hypothetical protein HN873_013973 [Arachis hypogaea]
MVNSQLEYSIFQTYSFIFGRKPKSQRCTTCIVDWKPILALEIAFMMKFLTIFRLENLAFLSLGNYFFEEQFELDLFSKYKMLKTLNLSSNELSLFSQKKGAGNVTTLPPFQLIALASGNLT